MQILDKVLPPHFTRRNRIIFFLALLFSFSFLFALLKVQPKYEDQSRTMLATLVDQNQFVSRKFSNSLSFIEIDKGEKLFSGDQIFTGDNSTAKVVFLKSGNILNIPQRGLVKIEEGLGGENVDIQKGLAEFVIQKGQSMNIIQGTETITLQSDLKEQGTGKIFFNNKKIVLQVDSGKISLNDSSGKVQEVNKNESISIPEQGIKKIIRVGLTKPVYGQKIDIWQGLLLEWSNKDAIDVVLSKDSDFKEVIGSTTAAKTPYKWVLPLQEGQYYLKVKLAGSKDKDATTLPLEMYSSHKISEFAPADKSSVNLKRGDSLRLSWNEVPAARYKVTLQNDEGKTASYMTDKAEYEVHEINGSTLDWSVAPQLTSGAMLSDSVTNHVNLIFDGENTIVSPKNNQRFLFGKEKVEINWSTTKNERTHIKLVNTSINQIVIDNDTMDSKFTFTPEAPGVYSLEVSSRDFPNPRPLGVKFLVVSEIAEWELKAPVELSSIDFEEKKVELKFIPRNKNLTEYELSVYSDTALKNKIITSKVPSNTIFYKMKNFGTFCFILRPVKKAISWLPSASQCIIYTEKAPFDVIASAKNIILKYKKVNGVGSYLINLPEVSRASVYEVQVFDKTKKVIFSDSSKNNVITWPSSKTGIFYYRYRVVDSKGRASDFSGVSKLIFPISPLTDWKE